VVTFCTWLLTVASALGMADHGAPRHRPRRAGRTRQDSAGVAMPRPSTDTATALRCWSLVLGSARRCIFGPPLLASQGSRADHRGALRESR
jgi:hypothetical protein